jgi:chorismate mutase/prephenate dehydratase
MSDDDDKTRDERDEEEKKALTGIRDRIDAIDDEMLQLLNERAGLAIQVGQIKKASSGDVPPVFYRPEREAQILSRLKQANPGPLTNDDIAHLYREVISCCLNLEAPLTIAYFGPRGNYTETAAIKHFGHSSTMVPLGAINDVFREVESGSVHYGVVPVENSTEGMVNHTLDCFIGSNLSICAEVEIPIHHAFMVHLENTEGVVKEIVSHSNAEAAQMLAQKPEAAAIGGEINADYYGLRVLATNIEDDTNNKTRFLVIGNQEVGPCGQDKTSILVSTRNTSGALFSVLEPFHRNEISLARIESRPARSGDWSYVFFIDFFGHQTDPAISDVLREVNEVALEVRVLGSYPEGTH